MHNQSSFSTSRVRGVMVIFALGMALSCGSEPGSTGPEHSPPDTSPASHAAPPIPMAPAQSHVVNAFPIVRGVIPPRVDRKLGTAGLPPDSASPLAGGTTTEALVTPTGTLVLYDDTGPWGWLGELYAIGAQTLASHFGTATSKPVAQYVAGDVPAHAATIYIGSTFDQALPTAFLDDVLAGTSPVLWIDDNIWELVNRSGTFGTTYGFSPWVFDTSSVATVDYKGASLARYAANGAGIMTYSAIDATKAQVVATAVRADGTQFPWAIRGKNLTYIGENPFAFISANDRYLAFCDVLYDLLAPGAAERHRALVRIEDVDATADPTALRAIADYLAGQQVPFSVATIPVYTDPLGYYNGGVPETIRLSRATDVTSALRYMVSKGGTIVMHGYTHQYSNVKNPYTGVTADDFEFYTSTIDANDFVVYLGPVANDSTAWASDRITRGLRELRSASLPTPTIFEYPHYAGSDTDSRAIRTTFKVAYHRGVYFGGALAGGTVNYEHAIQLFYPYTVQDIYGFSMIPENIGNYEPLAMNNNPPRLVPDLLATVTYNRVIRDGFASFFFHPYYDLQILRDLVQGVKAAGYTFVAPTGL